MFLFQQESRQLLQRLLFLVVLFLVYSGIIGYWVIGTSLLFDGWFYIYGNLGKVALFGMLSFGLIAGEKIRATGLPKVSVISWWMLLGSLAGLLGFYVVGEWVLRDLRLGNVLLLHGLLIGTIWLLVTALIGASFMRKLWKEFRNELMICLGIAMVIYFMIFQVWKLWPYFSDGVLYTLAWVFGLTWDKVYVFAPRTLLVEGFEVSIAEACSGLDSIFMFAAFYIVVGFVERKRFNLLKYVLLFVPALVGMYVVNIVRVGVLVLIGAFVSEKLAIGLFHTYAGMVLFIVYFGLFWKMFYQRLIRK